MFECVARDLVVAGAEAVLRLLRGLRGDADGGRLTPRPHHRRLGRLRQAVHGVTPQVQNAPPDLITMRRADTHLGQLLRKYEQIYM